MKLLRTVVFCLLLPLGVEAQENLRVFFAGNGVPTWPCNAAQYVDRDTNLLYLCNDATRTWGSGIPTLSLLPSLNLSDLLNSATARTNLGLGTLATQNGAVSNFALTDMSNVFGSVNVLNFPSIQAASQSGTWTVGITGTVPISGALTDAQLRATAVPVSVASVPSHPVTNAGTFAVQVSNFPATQPVSLATNTPDVTDRVGRLLGHVTVDSMPSTPVTGPLTDTQLRASPILVQEGSGTRFSCFVQAVTVITQCQVAPSAGLRNYITSATFSNGAATAQTLDVVYGTGANCATGITALTHKVQLGTNSTTTSPFMPSITFATPLVPATASAICIRPSAASVFGVTLTGFVGP